ncbi:MAG: hypothetical protein ACJ8H8_00540 [Geminicoccaceae bacterium]|jgi:hypothetical protein
MYLNLRRYRRIGVSKDVIQQSVEAELLPELQKQAGFKGYCAFWDQDDAGVSLSLFDDPEAAHRSTDAARRWVMRHRDFFPARFEEFSGECVAYEVAHGQEQGSGDARQALYVLIRELDNVPGTQDTRAFVQQRTLPMITRSPGFRGVYMARHDRTESRAAVVTLFDSDQQARACHEKAVALLREGLPKVNVTRVIEGESVILRMNPR